MEALRELLKITFSNINTNFTIQRWCTVRVGLRERQSRAVEFYPGASWAYFQLYTWSEDSSMACCRTSCRRNHSWGHEPGASSPLAHEAWWPTQNVDHHVQGGPCPPQRTGRLRPQTMEPGLETIGIAWTQKRQAWAAAVRKAVVAIDAGVTAPRWMPLQVSSNCKKDPYLTKVEDRTWGCLNSQFMCKVQCPAANLTVLRFY